MSRFASYLFGSRSTVPDISTEELVKREMAEIDAAMNAAGLIMNDDIEGAEEGLKGGESAFHLLALGVCTFMRAVLGVEKEAMNEASARLNQCCTKANADRDGTSKRKMTPDRIYPPGSEFSLVEAEAHLMIAVVSVMHESLPGVVRGFWKLKTAFGTLSKLIVIEEEALRKRRGGSGGKLMKVVNGSAKSEKMQEDEMPGSFDKNEFVDFVSTKASESSSSSSSEVFLDAKTGTQPPSGINTPAEGNARPSTSDDDIFVNPLDAFIHSGTNMCFGILLLLISMVPPVFSGPLGLVGLTGDRDRGLKMLWQSTKFDNVNGAVAGLVLLVYYNGQLAFGDILRSPRDLDEGANDSCGVPEERCRALLDSMRRRYPDSGLWKLEEARGHNNSRRSDIGIEMLKNMESRMPQVNALSTFELGLTSMFKRDWIMMEQSFEKCIRLNSWSHAMYFYIRACAEIELYRDAVMKGDAKEAENRKELAKKNLNEVPKRTGKASILARPMPFEVFVMHKVTKWEVRSRRLEVDLVDAIGVSPAGEMSFLWNGGKKMTPAELEGAEADLAWGRLTAPKDKSEGIMAEVDERGVRDVCLASLERERGRWEESRKRLDEVVKVEKNMFKGPNKDDYVLPSAYYELAVLAWFQCCRGPESYPSSSSSTIPSLSATPFASKSQIPAPQAQDTVNTNVTQLSEKTGKLSLEPTTGNSRSAAVSVATTDSTTGVLNGTATAAGDPEKLSAQLEGAKRTTNQAEEYRRRKAFECLGHLEKVAGWGSFVLDARMGIRVQTGLDNVRWLIEKKGWAAP